ncbi:MAG: response regulator [Bdellovibrionales bacterium]|nr:response regulator [Bdellovibrionales bacterium]
MLRKILLVIEDYHERTYLQTMLKKIGWDVIGLSTELGLSEQVLTFRPDVMLLSQMIRRARGLDISKNIKRRDGFPKVILLGASAPNKEILMINKVDLFLNSPVNNRLLFEFLEKAGGFSAKASLQKIRNMKHPHDNTNFDSAKAHKTSDEQKETLGPTIDKVVFDQTSGREIRYNEFLK